MVLTKPLGTQLAVNLAEWLRDAKTRPHNNRYAKVADIISPEGAVKAYKTAERSMARLNRTGVEMFAVAACDYRFLTASGGNVGAKLMHKYKAHGCTDVTGFGILGHAQNLAEMQHADVDIVLHTAPVR